ncbi:hypothetical protein A361_27095 [Cytobacillus oceanisediminis 2691]|jgi:hypothetical protein|uniref:Uncharacterized protein n=2 Tax=Cytobacillus oceanisediminis TaxID=665099 RepID=A0A161IZ39_9BACI|nr:hypothetical protein A361_27095 [Cytobacillus oceanisediminis 2691]OHX45779.1 hypothetical protein BBV17_01435 [Cytobacillus oceanisediminis]
MRNNRIFLNIRIITLNFDNCLAPAPTPSRSQAKPPRKVKNTFPLGSSCAWGPQDVGHADVATGRGVLSLRSFGTKALALFL